MSLMLCFGIGFLSGLLSLGASYVNHRRAKKHFPNWVLLFSEVWSPWSYESIEEIEMHKPESWPSFLTPVGFLLNIPYWWIRLPAAFFGWILIVKRELWRRIDRTIGQ